MNSAEIMIARLSSTLLSKSAISFFINGGPGTGKSYLVKYLAEKIPSEIPCVNIIGPHFVDHYNVNDLPVLQMQECLNLGFLNAMPPKGQMQDISDSWLWLGRQKLFSSRQIFVIFVEFDSDLNLSSVVHLFSRARYLETVWRDLGAQLLYVFVGSWDTNEISVYCDRIGVSFPYTIGRNYVVWEGIDFDSMVTLVKQKAPDSLDIHGSVLLELTGGNPTIALAILEEIHEISLSVKRLIDATYKVAQNSQITERLLAYWPLLSSQAQEVIKQLLYRRYLLDSSSASHVRRLLELGIVKHRQIGNNLYLEFRSWYIELLFRLHLESLGIVDQGLAKVQVHEMIPPIVTVSQEAFALIHDIENNVRDFVTIWLCMHNQKESHILKGKVLRYVEGSAVKQDIYDSAESWREKSVAAGVSGDLNPLISYCSTRDLARVLEEISWESRCDSVQKLARQIRELANLRDTVMHNQLIDDSQLMDLYKLQATIYNALAQVKIG